MPLLPHPSWALTLGPPFQTEVQKGRALKGGMRLACKGCRGKPAHTWALQFSLCPRLPGVRPTYYWFKCRELLFIPQRPLSNAPFLGQSPCCPLPLSSGISCIYPVTGTTDVTVVAFHLPPATHFPCTRAPWLGVGMGVGLVRVRTCVMQIPSTRGLPYMLSEAVHRGRSRKLRQWYPIPGPPPILQRRN